MITAAARMALLNIVIQCVQSGKEGATFSQLMQARLSKQTKLAALRELLDEGLLQKDTVETVKTRGRRSGTRQIYALGPNFPRRERFVEIVHDRKQSTRSQWIFRATLAGLKPPDYDIDTLKRLVRRKERRRAEMPVSGRL